MSLCGKLSGTQRCKFFFSFKIGINSLLQKGWFVEDLIVQTLVFSFSFTGRIQCVCVCVICTRVCDFSLLSFLRSYLNPQGLYVADVLDSFVTACVSVLLVLTSWSSKSHCQMCFVLSRRVQLLVRHHSRVFENMFAQCFKVHWLC